MELKPLYWYATVQIRVVFLPDNLSRNIRERRRNPTWGVSCLWSLLTRRGCCSLTHDGTENVFSSSVRLEFTQENVRKSLSGSNTNKQTGKKMTIHRLNIHSKLNQTSRLEWYNTFFLWNGISKVDEYGCKKPWRNYTKSFFSFFFFCLQMVGEVGRKDCGRRLDASRFSHCCQRHLRWNAVCDSLKYV